MKTLTINKANALKAFKEADVNGKKLLSNLIGEEHFSQKITDQVKTFEDACEVLGIDPETVLVKARHEDTKSINAYCKLIIIARALNEGWVPDWTDSSEYKYYPWLEYKSGLGFSYCVGGYSCAFTYVCSRLCFKSSELAKYAGTQFQSIYNDFFIL